MGIGNGKRVGNQEILQPGNPEIGAKRTYPCRRNHCRREEEMLLENEICMT
jgi:hypothetical protein